jgi:hypothetical protein
VYQGVLSKRPRSGILVIYQGATQNCPGKLMHFPAYTRSWAIFEMIVKILTIAHDGVLAGKRPNFSGQLRAAPWYFLQSRTWIVKSVPHGTLTDGLR